MSKVFVVAGREFRAMVGTKAFLFSMAMMPILMFGSFAAMKLLNRTERIEDRRLVIVDHTGRLFAGLKAAAEAHNQRLDVLRSSTGQADSRDGKVSGGERYFLEQVPGDPFDDDARCLLSDRVRRREIDAFVEIPRNVLPEELDQPPASALYFSSDSVLSSTRRWLHAVLNSLVSGYRLEGAGIDARVVDLATRDVPVEPRGLYTKDVRGIARASVQKSEMATIFLPMSCMMLMFMVIFMAAQPSLESVLEEKSSRVVEVLLGSVNPTQLMLGKLLGTVAGSLVIFAVYLGGALVVARGQGMLDDLPLPWSIIPWFIAFQILGVLFFSAIFMAVGAAVTQLKEAQSMLLPVWLLLMLPMFVWFQVIREPNGPVAVWLSFFPPATPSMIILRLATDATIPLWQVYLGLVLLIVATLSCVWIAGRIFRVGILWQGRTPRIRELVRWGLHAETV